MWRRRLLNLSVFGIVLTIFFFLHNIEMTGVIGTFEGMEFQTIEKEYYSRHADPAYYVIDDAEKWAWLWYRHERGIPPRPPPEVDFSKSTIIAVFMGEFNTGGYGIEIKEIINRGRSIVVKVEKTYPGKGCGVTEAFSQPYHIVKVDKIDKPLIFDTYSGTIECG